MSDILSTIRTAFDHGDTPLKNRALRKAHDAIEIMLASKSTMTDAELTVMGHLVDAWNAFVKLPIEHADDADEFRHAIHALQSQIMARPVRRGLKGSA